MKKRGLGTSTPIYPTSVLATCNRLEAGAPDGDGSMHTGMESYGLPSFWHNNHADNHVRRLHTYVRKRKQTRCSAIARDPLALGGPSGELSEAEDSTEAMAPRGFKIFNRSGVCRGSAEGNGSAIQVLFDRTTQHTIAIAQLLPLVWWSICM